MPRLWVVLLVVWYRAVAMASTQNVDQAQLTDRHGDPSILQKASHSAWQYSDNKVERQKRSNPLENDNDIHLKNGISDSKLEQTNIFNPGRSDENEIPVDTKQIADKEVYDKDVGSLESNEAYIEDPSDDLLSLMTYYKNDLYRSDILQDKEMLDSVLDKCFSHIKVKKNFNSWGGKRSVLDDDNVITTGCWNLVEQLNQQNDIKEQSDSFNNNKRDKFSSWGGKRNTDIDNGPKRLPFRAWGGKRENALSPKRIPFGPWKGKRTGNAINYLSIPFKEEDKRTTFNSWGGKRSLNHNSFIPTQQYRSMTSSLDDENYNDGYGAILYRNTPFPWQIYKELSVGPSSRNRESSDQRRIKFNSWGGKRLEDYDAADNLSEDKRTFNAWGGKRGLMTRTFNAWGGKRKLLDAEFPIYEGSKRTFNAWGG